MNTKPLRLVGALIASLAAACAGSVAESDLEPSAGDGGDGLAAGSGGAGLGQPGAPHCSIAAAPASVLPDEALTVEWSSVAATSCTLAYSSGGAEPTEGAAACSGATSFVPAAAGLEAGHYQLVLSVAGDGGQSSCWAQFQIREPLEPTAEPTCSIEATPQSVLPDEDLVVQWDGQHTTSCTLAVDGGDAVELDSCSDSAAFKPADVGLLPGSHSLVMAVQGPGGASSCATSFEVLTGCQPGGLVSGSATVQVSGADAPPPQGTEKGVIFCLANATTGFFVNVRHRSHADDSGSYYQIKGAFDGSYTCTEEVNYWQKQPACDGDWTVAWDGTTGEVTIASPCGTETIWFEPGPFTITDVLPGASCNGGIWWDAATEATVGPLQGQAGEACPCSGS